MHMAHLAFCLQECCEVVALNWCYNKRVCAHICMYEAGVQSGTVETFQHDIMFNRPAASLRWQLNSLRNLRLPPNLQVCKAYNWLSLFHLSQLFTGGWFSC